MGINILVNFSNYSFLIQKRYLYKHFLWSDQAQAELDVISQARAKTEGRIIEVLFSEI